jgi:plasmid stabilization system protein ParE
MTRKVVWSRDALNEIKAVVSYIAEENPSAARAVAAALRATGDKLGQKSTGRKGRVMGTFEKSVLKLPYVIAYAIETVQDSESIVILRVIHTSRNWKKGSWPTP